MKINQYDKVRLKDGRTCTVVDILEEDVAYIVDIDVSEEEWETIEILQSDIDEVI